VGHHRRSRVKLTSLPHPPPSPEALTLLLRFTVGTNLIVQGSGKRRESMAKRCRVGVNEKSSTAEEANWLLK